MRNRGLLPKSFLLFFMSRPFWKPPFSYTFALLFQLQDAPKRRESRNAKYCRCDKIFYNDGQNAEYDTCHQERPPALCAEVVLCFDYNRMKKSYNQKSCKTNYYSCKVHITVYYFCEASQRSASRAAIHPEPAATIA